MAEDVEQQLRALATQVEQLDKHGDKEQALALVQAAYDLSQHPPHPDSLVVAALMHTLGERYRAMGLYEQALPLVHQALTLRHEVLGLAHPLVAASMHTVGELHQENLMAVDSVICGYIRARTGDTHAADEITQATRLSLCGYSRAQTGDANATEEEVAQEAFRAFVRAGFAKYDPAKGHLTTYAKGCAHLMLMRYYTAQQQWSRVTMLLSDFRTRYPGWNDEAETRDVLERLPAVATPSRETTVIAMEESDLRQQVLEELYRLTFAGGLCPPHEVIALGFRKLWHAQGDEEAGASPGQSAVIWPPRRMVSKLSDTPLAILHTQLEDELVEQAELPAERVRAHLRGLRDSLAHGVDRLVHAMLPPQRAATPATAERHPVYTLRPWMCAFAFNALQRQIAEEISKVEYEHLLQALQAWVVGQTIWQHYYTSTRPENDIAHWCENVERQVQREIRTQGKGHLFLMLQQAKERRGRP